MKLTAIDQSAWPVVSGLRGVHQPTTTAQTAAVPTATRAPSHRARHSGSRRPVQRCRGSLEAGPQRSRSTQSGSSNGDVIVRGASPSRGRLDELVVRAGTHRGGPPLRGSASTVDVSLLHAGRLVAVRVGPNVPSVQEWSATDGSGHSKRQLDSSSAFIRSSVARIPSRLVRPRAQPSSFQ